MTSDSLAWGISKGIFCMKGKFSGGAWAESGADSSSTMDKVTAISIYVTYGLAVFLFLLVAAVKVMLRANNTGLPPALPVGKVPEWWYRKIDLIGAAVITAFFFLILVMNELEAEKIKDYQITAADLIFNIGLQFFLAGLVIAIVLGRVSPIRWLGLKWKDWPWVVLIAPVTVLAMWAIFAGLYAIGYDTLMESLDVKQVQDTVELLNETKDISVLVLMSITAVFVAPLCEEVVFRGYLYPVLKKFNGVWIASVVSALIFSAAHGSMSALLPLFIFGLALVLLYEITGSIWAPISAHFLFNAATVTIQMLVRFDFIPEHALK